MPPLVEAGFGIEETLEKGERGVEDAKERMRKKNTKEKNIHSEHRQERKLM